jgi:hypothetical protein
MMHNAAYANPAMLDQIFYGEIVEKQHKYISGMITHAADTHCCLLRNPSVFSWVGRQVSPSDSNGESASMLLTMDLRALCDAIKLGLPEGAAIGSHSWREMAAVSSHNVGYSDIRYCTHGH